MPSAKILEAKKALVADLNEKISSSLAGVVVAYNGISVADDTKLRKELREAGVHYMVVKNTMLRLAVKGTQYEGLTDYFKGDTAIALSAEDPAAAARILCKFADADKSKRFVVKGGFCDGVVMDAAGVKSLSTMPNREGLLSMLAGSLNGIIGGLAAYPVAKGLMGLTPAAYTVYIVPFLISTVAGSILAGILVFALEKSGAVKSMRASLEH